MKGMIMRVLNYGKRIVMAVLIALILLSLLPCTNAKPVFAEDGEFSVNGDIYSYDKKSDYEVQSGTSRKESGIGNLKISGKAASEGEVGDYQKINVSEGNIKISYDFDKDSISKADSDWYVISDGSKNAWGEKLDDDIKRGAVIVQSSFDGKKWIKTSEITDFFEGNSHQVYETKDTQTINGCYFRIIVVYKETIKKGTDKILFVKKNDYDYRKVAEVYRLFVVNENQKKKSNTSPDVIPRQELGNLVNAGDNGYSEKNKIDAKDVHYGWSLGTFIVNGYSQMDGKANHNPVFLKNVGDQVTLWFKLNQNIDQLNGDDALSISNDKNGYDEYFQTDRSNRGTGRGMLVVRYTDSQNHKYDPVVYTDYLAACSTTSADTRISLNQEGYYEVALDYEIKSSPRKVGPVNILPSHHNYRLSFDFSVHNGNVMLYTFDSNTGSELFNGKITPNGFRVDMAKSNDLEAFVNRINVVANDIGVVTEDDRGTKPIKDGETYTDQGIYKLSVKNTYTKKELKKTIYVGNNAIIKCLAETGLSVEDLNKVLKDGYRISDTGLLIKPSVQQMSSEHIIADAANKKELDSEAEEKEIEGLDVQNDDNVRVNQGKKVSSNAASMLITLLILIVAFVIIVTSIKGRQKKKDDEKEDNDDDENEQKDDAEKEQREVK